MGTLRLRRPRSVIDVRLDPVTAPQLGVTRTLAAVNLALASGDVPVGSVWEGDYRLPIVLKNDTRQGERSLSDIGDTYISSPVPSVSVPLRQIADVEPVWSQSKIVHRNGMRCITVTADLKRGANAMRMTSRISDIIDRELVPRQASPRNWAAPMNSTGRPSRPSHRGCRSRW